MVFSYGSKVDKSRPKENVQVEEQNSLIVQVPKPMELTFPVKELKVPNQRIKLMWFDREFTDSTYWERYEMTRTLVKGALSFGRVPLTNAHLAN